VLPLGFDTNNQQEEEEESQSDKLNPFLINASIWRVHYPSSPASQPASQ